jgi:hypothetical protein
VKSATVTQILKGNAAVVSQPPLCGCAGPCDCLIARLSASKRKEEVRRLLNLAIASTVVIIRKTLSEWAPNGMVVAGAPRTEPAAFAMLATRRYDSFKQIRVVGPWLLLAGVPEKIESPMSTLKRTVDRLNEGGLGQERFRSEFEQAVGVLSRAFGENPEVLTKERPGLLRIRMSGLPPILPGPARFRVPTAAERDVDAGWSAYVALSDRFDQALLLYQSGIHAAVLNAVRRDVSRERQERIDRTLKGLAAAQDDSMKALARR